MVDPAEKPIPKKRADYSTMEGFSFGFFCDACAREWRSVPYGFNPGSFSAPIDSTVFQWLWNDQHRAAYERASLDVSFEFNRCPVCGRRVCKECFYVSGSGISDICRECLCMAVKAGAKETPAKRRA